MGLPSDPLAVVDERLRVHGLERPAGRRRLGHADDHLGQHQHADHHDRRACVLRKILGLVATLGLSVPAVSMAQQPTTLRVVAHSDLKILDPIWTTAYIVRNHGYMIYDTLFALDGKGEIQPQMVDKWTMSDDKLTWTFTLRDGLEFHDGQPVTTEDVIASLKRWASRDAWASAVAVKVAELKARRCQDLPDRAEGADRPRAAGPGKPSGNVPFIMPKRVAETPGTEQITEFVGSGPFIFKADEWKPGDRTVYVRFPKYKPRPSRPRVWPAARSPRSIGSNGRHPGPADRGQRAAGRRDRHHRGAAARPAAAAGAEGRERLDGEPTSWGNQYIFRFNSCTSRSTTPRSAQAMLYDGFNQKDFLKAVIGDPNTTRSARPCSCAARRYATERASRTSMKATSPRPSSCWPRAATTARRSCCCIRPTSTC
jgi:peptide/nickel transport system substrate-binding protein